MMKRIIASVAVVLIGLTVMTPIAYAGTVVGPW